jgi:hypothetical protein
LGWLGFKHHSYDCKYCDVACLVAKEFAISFGDRRRVRLEEFEVFEITGRTNPIVKPDLKRH